MHLGSLSQLSQSVRSGLQRSPQYTPAAAMSAYNGDDWQPLYWTVMTALPRHTLVHLDPSWRLLVSAWPAYHPVLLSAGEWMRCLEGEVFTRDGEDETVIDGTTTVGGQITAWTRRPATTLRFQAGAEGL